MENDYSEYFRALCDRVSTAVKVPFREVSLAGWQPRLNDCHGNAKFWAENNPGAKIVQGWLFWPPDMTGRYTFRAHSVIEQSGQLIDITPIEHNTPRDGLLFLKHLGTEEDFEPMKTVCSEVLYPPMMMEELQASHFLDMEEEAGF